MKKIIPFIIVLLTGCSTTFDYDYSNRISSEPIRVAQSIPFIDIGSFEYDQHRNLTSYELSTLGCLMCDADGGSAGFTYKQPVSEIIRQEVEMALTEVSLGEASHVCALNASIHLAGNNQVTGDQVLDMTYSLLLQNDVKFSKRIKSRTDHSLFSLQRVDRMLAEVTRQSVQDLVTNRAFLKSVRENCS